MTNMMLICSQPLMSSREHLSRGWPLFELNIILRQFGNSIIRYAAAGFPYAATLLTLLTLLTLVTAGDTVTLHNHENQAFSASRCGAGNAPNHSRSAEEAEPTETA